MAQSGLNLATFSPSNSPSVPLSARSNNMKRSAQLVPRQSASRHPPIGPTEGESRRPPPPAPPPRGAGAAPNTIPRNVPRSLYLKVLRQSASRHPPMAESRLDPVTISLLHLPLGGLSAASTRDETFRAARTSPKRFPSSAGLVGDEPVGVGSG